MDGKSLMKNLQNMKISLITATYNSEKTLRSTFESILSQTFKNIDYWVIDGGSNDETVDIIKEYEHKFNGCMHYISEKDRGIYDAMNKGIKHCTGDIVGILNSDDYFTDENVLMDVNRAFCNNDIDAVFGDIHFVADNNLNKVVRYYSSAMFKPFWLRFGFMPAHPSFYVKREVYMKYGGYSLDYKIASDYDMMVRLFYKQRISYKYLKRDFVTMRTGGVSTKNVKNRLLITKEDVKACRAYGLYTNSLMISVKYLYKIFEFL